MTNATRHAFVWSIVIGLACIVIKFLAWVPFRERIEQEAPTVGPQVPAAQSGPVDIAWFLFDTGWLGPIIESLLFVLIWGLFLGLKLKGTIGALIYVVVVGILSWAIHGAALNNIGHGLAFALLAAWFWVVAQARGTWTAIATNVVAHGIWNTTLIVIWLIRNGT
jgi:hypothetical protein